MKYFEIDLNTVPKVALLGKETLIPPRSHFSRCIFDYLLYVIVNGSLELSINGVSETFTRGDVCLFQPGDKQEPVKSSFCEYYYVHFLSGSIREISLTKADYADVLHKKQERCFMTDAFTAECYEFLRVILPERSHISNQEAFGEIGRILQNNILTSESKLPEKRLAISNAVSSVMLKTEAENIKSSGCGEQKFGKGYDTVRTVAAYIQEHCTEPISGDDIEKRFFLTFDYVNRIFKNIMGCTIVRYRNIARIQYAKSKIRASNQPIKEIAAETGFENVNYFNRIFKKFEGLSPSEYKQKFKENI